MHRSSVRGPHAEFQGCFEIQVAIGQPRTSSPSVMAHKNQRLEKGIQEPTCSSLLHPALPAAWLAKARRLFAVPP